MALNSFQRSAWKAGVGVGTGLEFGLWSGSGFGLAFRLGSSIGLGWRAEESAQLRLRLKLRLRLGGGVRSAITTLDKKVCEGMSGYTQCILAKTIVPTPTPLLFGLRLGLGLMCRHRVNHACGRDKTYMQHTHGTRCKCISVPCSHPAFPPL